MKNLEINLESLFDEIVDRGRGEGITNQEGFNELLEEILMGHLDVGELDDQNTTSDLTEQLRSRWPDYKEALGLDEEQPEL